MQSSNRLSRIALNLAIAAAYFPAIPIILPPILYTLSNRLISHFSGSDRSSVVIFLVSTILFIGDVVLIIFGLWQILNYYEQTSAQGVKESQHLGNSMVQVGPQLSADSSTFVFPWAIGLAVLKSAEAYSSDGSPWQTILRIGGISMSIALLLFSRSISRKRQRLSLSTSKRIGNSLIVISLLMIVSFLLG